MNDKPQHPSTSSSSHDVVSTLVAHDAYIVTLLKDDAYTHLSFMDREDLTQEVRLKIMDALNTKSIHNLRMYLKSVAHNEYVSYVRRQRPVLPLTVGDEGEVLGYQDSMLVVREGFGDPQVAFQATYNYHERLEAVVRLIVALPDVQKRVAVCVLRDRVDDPHLLAEKFSQHNLDISALQWPTDPRARQRLQASYGPVRQKLAQALGIDLTFFKGKRSSSIL